MAPQPRDWQALAEQISKETDPGTLTDLIAELNQVLEREEKQRSLRHHADAIGRHVHVGARFGNEG
jgi:hypothetical protein